MSFGHPHAFWLLLVVGALAALDQLRRTGPSRAWPKIFRLRAHATHIEYPPPVTGRDRRWRLWTGLALLVVALAQPQAGHVRRPVPPPAREILVALDLSRSMLARDVKPSRLDHAKLLLAGMLDQTVGDHVGLVLFASSAYLQLPLSADYELLSELLPNLTPAYFPKSGTNFGTMLATSLASFTSEPGVERYLVVVSDGEAFDGEWRKALPELARHGIRVISVGIGSKAGAVLANENGPLRTPQGGEVVSHLNSTTLEELAKATGGTYAAGDSWVDIRALLKTADAPKKAITYVVDPTRLVERYRWVLLPACLLLAWSFWVEFPVKPSLRQIQLPPTKPSPRGDRSSVSTAPHKTAVASAALALLLAVFVTTAPWIHAHDEDEEEGDEHERNTHSSLPALSSLVSQRLAAIIAKPAPSSSDLLSLVIDIIGFGENTLRARQRFPVSVLDDANKAIDWAARLDPKGGDWEKLRADILTLYKADTEPWKTTKPTAPGKVDMEVGFDPKTEMKDDKHASGLGIVDVTSESDANSAKATFVDTPAFGEMKAGTAPLPDSNEPPVESDQQVIGGKKNAADAERDRHPELVLPLQRLELVRRNDTPAKLFEMLDANRGQFVPPTPEW